MKILIVPNSFKGSIISTAVSRAIAKGIRKIKADVEIEEKPVADGGLGTLEILTKYYNGKFVNMRVTGPLGKRIKARYGIVPGKNLAIIELAQAAGLHLLINTIKNPLHTTTIGIGELIKNSIKKNCKTIILGVGDSATIDCGIGAMSALGIKFFDRKFKLVETSCAGLLNLWEIDNSEIEMLKSLEFIILVDVLNKLTGSNGAIAYAQQKGATKKDMTVIKQALTNFKNVVLKQFRINLDRIKGTGAAGGTAGGMYAILNAKIVPGFFYFEKIFKLSAHIKNADLIITGEGNIDRTTFYGKITGRIIALCKKYKKPVILVCGDYSQNLNYKNYRIKKIYSLINETNNKKVAEQNAFQLLIKIGSKIAREI